MASSSPSSKGKQISVIIAGATGSTGRNLVTRLVSHPEVSRVVALARHPIPVNRWTSVFPHLHPGDALRYLSVVPVDWVKVLADSANIPSSYVSDGVWRQEEEERERLHFLSHMAHSQGLAGMVLRDRGGRLSFLNGTNQLSGMLGSKNGGNGGEPRTGEWSAVNTVESPVGIRPVGYVKYTPRGSFSSRQDAYKREKTEEESDRIDSPVFTDAEKLQDSQAFLRQLLHNNFYTSVFSGHTVAINCLGTSHMYSTGSVLLVDHELSIAFAKMMRLFNCMAHAESTEDEERLLVEATSRELDSVLWGEIYSACYGKRAEARGRGTQREHGQNGASASPDSDLSSTTASTGNEDEEGKAKDSWRAADPQKSDLHRMNRGKIATLKHFSQVSVRGANPSSPIPYLRAHGLRDRDLLRLFNRRTTTFHSPGVLHSMFLSKPTTHTVSVDGLDHSAEQLLSSSDDLISTSGSVHTGPSPMRALKETMQRDKEHQQQRAAGDASPSFSVHLWRVLQRSWRGNQTEEDTHGSQSEFYHRYDPDGTPEPVDDTPEAVARRRARLLLRRDVVKIWENSSITIWRPGVFLRPKPRLSEWIFSFFERPVDVRLFAECIVLDIMESVYKDTGFASFGTVKIINGKSVARRTTMKAIEDGLDQRDAKIDKFK